MMGAIQGPQYGPIISQVTIHIHTADLFGALMLQSHRGCFFTKQKKTTTFKQMSSIKGKQGKPHLPNPSLWPFLIVILSIGLISSSLLQHHLGTCDCTLRIRTKWFMAAFQALSSKPLRSTRHGIRKEGCSRDSRRRTDPPPCSM